MGILTAVEADINGFQRKVISARVRPARGAHGTVGIAVREGRTLPFEVTRAWSAPAGYYPEQWFLVDPGTKEVLYERPAQIVLVKGLQAITEFTDRIEEPLELAAGEYQIVFSLAALKGGELAVSAAEAPASDTAA